MGALMSNAGAVQPFAKGQSEVPALLDHLVWLAGDLDDACTQFEAMSGVAPRYGGAHPSGTHNAIVGLGDQVYLEIAAPVPDAEPGHPWVDAARRRSEPHLYSYCMRSKRSLSMLAEHAKMAGLSAFGPLPGSRTTPDGRTLEWDLFIPVVAGADKAIPFLIDWGKTPHPAPNASGAIKLVSFKVGHPAPDRIQAPMSMFAPGVELTKTAGASTLKARIATPLGEVVLRS